MTNDLRYSSATSAMLLAMTAIQCASGVEPGTALQRSHQLWHEHEENSWDFSQLVALVDRLAPPTD